MKELSRAAGADKAIDRPALDCHGERLHCGLASYKGECEYAEVTSEGGEGPHHVRVEDMLR